jgi:hypothetical protein
LLQTRMEKSIIAIAISMVSITMVALGQNGKAGLTAVCVH